MNVSNSSNATSAPFEQYQVWQKVLISLFLTILTVGTVIGNSLVCIAVGIVRRLQSPSNLLIVSLAVSDLLVALLVMPYATVYEVESYWILGRMMCDAWTSLDVLLCTASILNLCCISIDRYLVITRPFDYALKRTPTRMGLMILAVWLISAVVSIPPVFGWKKEPPEGHCMITQDIGYQFYATIFAFYLPLGVMIFIYYRIYAVSSRIAKREKLSQPQLTNLEIPLQEPSAANGSGGGGDSKSSKKSKSGHVPNREGKAIVTLGVIMGGFTACWLPFFILALIDPLCRQCIPKGAISFFQWLGYANSFLNPIIYARFNTEFRQPFKEILLCRCRGINSRLRNLANH